MHRVKNLFEQVCWVSNLRQAAKEALRGKRARLPGATFFMELEKELRALHEELRDGAYRHGAYHYFWIHDPKDRLVAAAPFRDRVVHHAIVRVIEPIFEKRFVEDSYACRLGKGTHAAMRRALHFAGGHRYALKCDVSKYFPSIDHEVHMGLVGRLIGDRGVLGLLEGILASHAGRVLTHQQLLREVWGPHHTQDTHYLRVHLAQLRRKIEPDPAQPQYLLSETGVGYRLAAE